MTELVGIGTTANLRRLQPLRILVSGRDRRFVRVTWFLLSRRGYVVARCDSGDALQFVAQHRPDVVLLEIGDSRSAAAQRLAALQALESGPGVVVVSDDDLPRWNGFRTVRKWVEVDVLVQEIEAAAVRRATPLAAVEDATP